MASIVSYKTISERHRSVDLTGERRVSFSTPHTDNKPSGLYIKVTAGLDETGPSTRDYVVRLTQTDVNNLLSYVNSIDE